VCIAAIRIFGVRRDLTAPSLWSPRYATIDCTGLRWVSRCDVLRGAGICLNYQPNDDFNWFSLSLRITAKTAM